MSTDITVSITRERTWCGGTLYSGGHTHQDDRQNVRGMERIPQNIPETDDHKYGHEYGGNHDPEYEDVGIYKNTNEAIRKNQPRRLARYTQGPLWGGDAGEGGVLHHQEN